MVSFKELVARTKQELEISRQEIPGLIIGILLIGFIFSFRYWGAQQFDLTEGLKNLLLITLAAGIAVFGHILLSKIYALSLGYKAEFKVWWLGLALALILAFITQGSLTVILLGTVSMALMVRQRLGLFRYGFSLEEQAITSLWGILGNIILAFLFRIGLYFFPTVLFFERGLMINLIFAICAILPLPNLGGLTIFFGSREIYFVSVVAILLTTLLLLLGGGWGLLLGIIVGSGIGLWFILISSEK